MQLAALSEICLPHSGQLIKAMSAPPKLFVLLKYHTFNSMSRLSAYKALGDMSKYMSFEKLQLTVLKMQESFPNLTKAITDTAAAATSGASAVDVLSVGFSGLGSIIKAHPILAAVAAISAVVSVVSAVSSAYQEYQQSLLEAVEAADEASTTWEEQRSSLSDYIERMLLCLLKWAHRPATSVTDWGIKTSQPRLTFIIT